MATMHLSTVLTRPAVRDGSLVLSGEGDGGPAHFLQDIDHEQSTPAEVTGLHEVRFTRCGALSSALLQRFLERTSSQNLRRLTLQSAELTDIEDLCRSSRGLEYADLSLNAVRALPERISALWTFVVELNLSCNRLNSWKEVKKLVTLLRLKRLNLAENPITYETEYRGWMIGQMPQLYELDTKVIDVETRRRAAIAVPQSSRGGAILSNAAVAGMPMPQSPLRAVPAGEDKTTQPSAPSASSDSVSASVDAFLRPSRTSVDQQYDELLSKIRASNSVPMSKPTASGNNSHLFNSPSLIPNASEMPEHSGFLRNSNDGALGGGGAAGVGPLGGGILKGGSSTSASALAAAAVPAAGTTTIGGSSSSTSAKALDELFSSSNSVLEHANRILAKTTPGTSPKVTSPPRLGGPSAQQRDLTVQRDQNSRSPLAQRRTNDTLRALQTANQDFFPTNFVPSQSNSKASDGRELSPKIGRRGLFDHSPPTNTDVAAAPRARSDVLARAAGGGTGVSSLPPSSVSARAAAAAAAQGAGPRATDKDIGDRDAHVGYSSAMWKLKSREEERKDKVAAQLEKTAGDGVVPGVGLRLSKESSMSGAAIKSCASMGQYYGGTAPASPEYLSNTVANSAAPAHLSHHQPAPAASMVTAYYSDGVGGGGGAAAFGAQSSSSASSSRRNSPKSAHATYQALQQRAAQLLAMGSAESGNNSSTEQMKEMVSLRDDDVRYGSGGPGDVDVTGDQEQSLRQLEQEEDRQLSENLQGRRRRIFRSLPPTTRVPRRPPPTVPSTHSFAGGTPAPGGGGATMMNASAHSASYNNQPSFWQMQELQREREEERRLEKAKLASIDARTQNYHSWLSSSFQPPGRGNGVPLGVRRASWAGWGDGAGMPAAESGGGPADGGIMGSRGNSHTSTHQAQPAVSVGEAYRQEMVREDRMRTWLDKSMEERKMYEDEAKLEALRVLQLKVPLNPRNLPIGVDPELLCAESRGDLTTKSHVADIMMRLVEKCERQHRLIAYMYKHLAIPRDWMIRTATKSSVQSVSSEQHPLGGGPRSAHGSKPRNKTPASTPGLGGGKKHMGYTPKMVVSQPGLSGGIVRPQNAPNASAVSAQPPRSASHSPEKRQTATPRFDPWSIYGSFETRLEEPNLKKFKYPRRQFGASGGGT